MAVSAAKPSFGEVASDSEPSLLPEVASTGEAPSPTSMGGAPGSSSLFVNAVPHATTPTDAAAIAAIPSQFLCMMLSPSKRTLAFEPERAASQPTWPAFMNLIVPTR